MIYLKKNEEEQELFIPKNGNYEGKKTFKDGVEYQKSLLRPIKFLKNREYENPNGWNKVTVDVPLGEHTITKNGIYDARNGYLVRGGNNIGTVFMLKGGGYIWNVNPANTLKIELLFKPANEYGEFFDNTIRGIFGYDFEVGKFYVAEDAQNPNLIYASVGGWESKRVELTPEWHIISLSNTEFRIDGVLIANIPEGEYTPLNTQILLNGINNGNGNSNYYYPNVGFYANFKMWADGVGVVDATPYFEDNSTFGYLNLYGARLNTEIWRVTNNWIALDEVNEPSFIEVQGFNYLTVDVQTGGECPELQELNVTENGTYEGAYNKVNVVVPQEGGSCNIEETRWVNPTPEEIDGSGYLVYHPTDGYDGMQRIALQMNNYNSIKYNEGYNDGKAEGGSCNLTELNIKWQSDWNENNYYADKQGYDGYSYVHIDVTTALKEKYDEGYNNAIANDANLTSSAVEKKFNTLALRTENIYDSDIIRDKTQLVGSGDEYTENGFISYTQNKNGIVISGSDEVGAKCVTKIRKGALNWNTIEYFYSYTIVNFGVDMTRDMGSNVRHLYIKYNGGVGTGVDSDIYFRTGCFATSNLLNKIVFYEPYYINVEDKAFEGVSSNGNVIVVGEDNAENRAKYDTLMSQLGDGWSLRFVDKYDE